MHKTITILDIQDFDRKSSLGKELWEIVEDHERGQNSFITLYHYDYEYDNMYPEVVKYCKYYNLDEPILLVWW